MGERFARPTGFSRILPALALLPLGACVSFRPVPSGSLPELRADQGILVLHVDSNVSIERLGINRFTAAEDLPSGISLRLVVTGSGVYHWTTVDVGISRVRLYPDDYWDFEVQAGKINYPGQLVIGTTRTPHLTQMFRLMITNQSSIARGAVEGAFPELLDRYPMVYTGASRDDFLIYYEQALQATRAAGTEEAPE